LLRTLTYLLTYNDEDDDDDENKVNSDMRSVPDLKSLTMNVGRTLPG